MNTLNTLDPVEAVLKSEQAAETPAEPAAQPLDVSAFKAGSVVTPVESLAGVLATDGSMLAAETVGPGIIHTVSKERGVLVHWLDAHTDAWMLPDEVRSPGEHAHLVAFYHCDAHGNRTLVKRFVDAHAGLDHNWVIELLPQDVVRAVRDDGLAWTFEWYYIFHRLHPKHTLWSPPPEDADAEALAAAELFFA